VLMDVDARHRPIMLARGLRSEIARVKVVIAQSDIALPPWR
jgi:hypothetical protein